jgi:glutathione peroxidase
MRSIRNIKKTPMKNLITYFLIALFFWSCKGQNEPINTNVAMKKQTIYQFKVNDLYGKPFDFNSLKGKKIMIVNTASKCGLTPQYKELEALYKKYSSSGLVIIGFPANNFGSQEPGTKEEIASFCTLNYGVTFPMMDKVSVKGSDICPVYQFLTQQSKNGLEDSDVSWNFQKYLLNEKGELVKVISPRVQPNDQEIIDWAKG